MKIATILVILQKYDQLLTRYARRFTKNSLIAEKIVTDVFEQYYEEEKELEAVELRKYLLERTRLLCQEWFHKNLLLYTKPTVKNN